MAETRGDQRGHQRGVRARPTEAVASGSFVLDEALPAGHQAAHVMRQLLPGQDPAIWFSPTRLAASVLERPSALLSDGREPLFVVRGRDLAEPTDTYWQI